MVKQILKAIFLLVLSLVIVGASPENPTIKITFLDWLVIILGSGVSAAIFGNLSKFLLECWKDKSSLSRRKDHVKLSNIDFLARPIIYELRRGHLGPIKDKLGVYLKFLHEYHDEFTDCIHPKASKNAKKLVDEIFKYEKAIKEFSNLPDNVRKNRNTSIYDPEKAINAYDKFRAYIDRRAPITETEADPSLVQEVEKELRKLDGRGT